MIGHWELLIVLVLVVIIFGVGKLPGVMGDLGKGVKQFKDSLNDEGTADKPASASAAKSTPKTADNGTAKAVAASSTKTAANSKKSATKTTAKKTAGTKKTAAKKAATQKS